MAMDNNTKNNVTENLLTIKDVEARLKLGHTKVTELVISGELPSLKIGRNRRVRPEDLNTFIEELLIQENLYMVKLESPVSPYKSRGGRPRLYSSEQFLEAVSEVLPQLKSGNISQNTAAYLLGMSTRSFKRYAVVTGICLRSK